MKRRKQRKRYVKGTWMKLRSKEILIAFMDDKNFSVTRLAQYAGCSRAMVGHLRSGHKTSCTPDLADRISEALGVPLVAIFEERTPTVSSRISPRQAERVSA